MPHPYLRRREDRPVLVMAHRGERGHAPENTMVSFKRAAAADVDVLELDIRASRDGVLHVFHDETLERTTSGTGPISAYSASELAVLDAGYHWTADDGVTFPFRGQGVTIPTLESLFETFPSYRMNVDIKQAAPPIVEPFVEMLRLFHRVGRTLVGSFHDDVVAAFRRALPEAPTAATASEARRFYILHRLGVARFGFGQPAGDALQLPEVHDGRRIITPRFIRDAHRQGTAVHVWTVNEVDDMRRLMSWDVDGIITDFPRRLLALIG